MNIKHIHFIWWSQECARSQRAANELVILLSRKIYSNKMFGFPHSHLSVGKSWLAATPELASHKRVIPNAIDRELICLRLAGESLCFCFTPREEIQTNFLRVINTDLRLCLPFGPDILSRSTLDHGLTRKIVATRQKRTNSHTCIDA